MIKLIKMKTKLNKVLDWKAWICLKHLQWNLKTNSWLGFSPTMGAIRTLLFLLLIFWFWFRYFSNQIQGDPKFSPPLSTKIESCYEKLTNAFSNTIYLKIIWIFSNSGIEYLRHTVPFAKIDSVSFLLFFGHLIAFFD